MSSHAFVATWTIVLGASMVVWHRPLGEFLPGFFRNDRYSQIAYMAGGILLTIVGIALAVGVASGHD